MGETYDWRLSVPNMEKRDRYFTRLKWRIELSHFTTGEKVPPRAAAPACTGARLYTQASRVLRCRRPFLLGLCPLVQGALRLFPHWVCSGLPQPMGGCLLGRPLGWVAMSKCPYCSVHKHVAQASSQSRSMSQHGSPAMVSAHNMSAL